mmetsp:Transcript_3582/g.11202  ORF Transcript_3582/g.11202 Transcript_3582/m.11202 type:complete len:324 (-) Transcript_3582:67-1038(-)
MAGRRGTSVMAAWCSFRRVCTALESCCVATTDVALPAAAQARMPAADFAPAAAPIGPPTSPPTRAAERTIADILYLAAAASSRRPASVDATASSTLPSAALSCSPCSSCRRWRCSAAPLIARASSAMARSSSSVYPRTSASESSTSCSSVKVDILTPALPRRCCSIVRVWSSSSASLGVPAGDGEPPPPLSPGILAHSSLMRRASLTILSASSRAVLNCRAAYDGAAPTDVGPASAGYLRRSARSIASTPLIRPSSCVRCCSTAARSALRRTRRVATACRRRSLPMRSIFSASFNSCSSAMSRELNGGRRCAPGLANESINEK